MPKMIANLEHPFDGRVLRMGEEFEATDFDANVLRLMGVARHAPAPTAIETREIVTAPKAAEPKRRSVVTK